MKVTFRSSFLRDLKKIRDRAVLAAVKLVLEQLETADTLEAIPELRKLAGASGFYRIKVGDYRIGLSISDGVLECVRCLHRRDIYKRFP